MGGRERKLGSREGEREERGRGDTQAKKKIGVLKLLEHERK